VRLFPATNGPTAPTSWSGDFISGVCFAVQGGNNWLDGYYWWVCTSGTQGTSPVKCATWSPVSDEAGTVVTGSVVTSGPLSPGWNYIPLPSPIQLAPSYSPNTSTYGSAYIAAVGVNGAFPDTANYWGTGGPGVGGITSGTLIGYSGTSGGGGTLEAPYSLPQGIFSDTGSDPSTTMPGQSSNVDNFWVDVQVSNSNPSYTGSYRLWPNKADSNPEASGDSAIDYVIATEVDLDQTCTLDYVHYYSQSGAASLATAANVWNISAGIPVASIPSPAWKDENGNSASAGDGWVKAAFPANTILGPGNYRVSVYNSGGTAGSWAVTDATTDYFTAGVASSGITWGPITAPDFSNAQLANVYLGEGTTGGQPVFEYHGSNTFPNYTTGNDPAQIYFVDLEVTPVQSGGLALMTRWPM
jgi:hypothetical protein